MAGFAKLRNQSNKEIFRKRRSARAYYEIANYLIKIAKYHVFFKEFYSTNLFPFEPKWATNITEGI